MSKDAKELNFLESCKGHKIEVCYINDCGNLKTNYEHFFAEEQEDTDIKNETYKEPALEQGPSDANESESHWSLDGLSTGIGAVCTILLGSLFYAGIRLIRRK